MKTVDFSFDKAVCGKLKSLIGLNFKKIKHDELLYKSSVTGVVGLYVADKVFELRSEQQPIDYFGAMDDMAVWKLKECQDEDIKSFFCDVTQIEVPISLKIQSIFLVNEKLSTEDYEVYVTRAIIFSFGDYELAFQKDVVPFSEEICILRGYNLFEKLEDKDYFFRDWQANSRPAVTREVVQL